MLEGELKGSLLSVIGGAGGKDLLQDAAELSLDAFLDDGIVKDIPVVGTVANFTTWPLAFKATCSPRKSGAF